MADSLLTDETSPGLDIESASDRIGASLFGPSSEPSEPDIPEQPDTAPSQVTAPPQASQPSQSPTQQTAVDLLPAPKSWRQDMHPYWQKMPKEAQQYYNEREQQMLNGMQQFKQIQAVIAPFEPVLSKRGISAYDWIRGLANTEAVLTQGTPEQRRAAYEEIGKHLGLLPKTNEEQQPPVDPIIKQLQDRQEAIERGLRAQHEAVVNETRNKVQQEIDAFAADKAHPYFDEVGDEIAAFVQQGLSLQDAYDRAVWANPVTRAKEQARVLTEHEAKLKENARLSNLPKKKAAGVNVRSADTGRTPTEPLGSMEDTIKETLRDIRSRAS